MLHDEEDPLSSSIFNIGNASSSFFGTSSHATNGLTTSFFSPHYDDDPWSTAIVEESRPIQQTFHPPPPAPPPSMSTTPAVTASVDNHDTLFEPSLSTVLNGVTLPDIYDTTFAQLQVSGRVSSFALRDCLERSGGLSGSDTDKILRIVLPDGGSYVDRAEFNVALALLACGQQRMGISLNTIQRHRYALPEPTLESPTPPIFQQQQQQQQQQRPPSIRTSDPLKQQHPETTSPLTGSESPKINGGYPGMDKSSEHSTPRVRSPELKHHNNNGNHKALDTRKWFHQIEEIKVTIAPEREGFIFKHVNYIIESQKRSSIVLRRFSDFWWLMEVLGRRYPFRILPNLPPKKVGGRDSAFLEKRRKGLSRFINAVVRHPVLRNDDVVIKFLTEPSELAAWRKQNPPSIEEEYRRTEHDMSELKSMIPSDLDDQLRKTRQRIGSAIDHYVNLCFIMERIIRRMHGQATDYVRYSIALNALAETEHRYHASDCTECQQVIQGYENVAKHMQRESTILENQVNAAADGVLENLKNFRDLLVAYRELDERREKLAATQIDSLTKRISANRAKVNQNKGVPGLEAEVAKLEESIRTDERELHDQKCRQIFIQFCMWSEIIYLHKQQAFVSSLYRNYVKGTSQYSRQRADNWSSLEELVMQMPVDPPLFN
ncbi:hypothetical protein LRAMOSA04512 [Lichtheimia ramosa]|uniref:Sorting nexin MVP1 n=1 Tax=Lichtheimia ramosa TaxID=688394 RepID=A0A077WZP5_9FUNG|nr:hypothetical protein LRAMOSA04512 [Lichtheimia ramosa]